MGIGLFPSVIIPVFFMNFVNRCRAATGCDCKKTHLNLSFRRRNQYIPHGLFDPSLAAATGCGPTRQTINCFRGITE